MLFYYLPNRCHNYGDSLYFYVVKIHEKYMRRCLELAANGLGKTYPNPLVGSVIVHNNTIIGEGWHRKGGGPHAEVHAVANVKDTSLLPEATLYVNLEPCSHHGRTPPCADMIISKEIKKVVIGNTDPNPNVLGGGIEKLRNAGCEVITDILKEECEELNKRFFTFHKEKRPYIILKWAKTADGFMGPDADMMNKPLGEREPIWITNTLSRQRVHKMRAEENAILVGTNTVLADNPSLTTRLWEGNSPVRVVLDRALTIPTEATVLNNKVKTIVITETESPSDNGCFYETIDFSESVVTQICAVLYKHEIRSVIVEGGAITLQSFIDSGYWDEARVFTGEQRFKTGLAAPEISGLPVSEESIANDTLQVFKNAAY